MIATVFKQKKLSHNLYRYFFKNEKNEKAYLCDHPKQSIITKEWYDEEIYTYIYYKHSTKVADVDGALHR